VLEGKNVNLRVMEKEDLPLFTEWVNKPQLFFVEKKDGSKIGFIAHFHVLHLGTGSKLLEIGYSLVPSERGKGYCTEAVEIMVDYLFLSRESMRIQACTDIRNLASQKVLEKAGFKREGIMRNAFFWRGKWTEDCLYSMVREEWKEPKILTRT